MDQGLNQKIDAYIAENKEQLLESDAFFCRNAAYRAGILRVQR